MLDLTKSTFVAASIASIAFMISNAAVSQDSTTHMQGEFLQRAVEAANWIESQQIKVDAATTWPSSPSQSGAVAFNLYSGNAGVVIFFLELHQATGDAKYLEFAQRGARALLAEVKNLTPKSDPGYWTGYTGIAATLAEVYRATEQEAFLKGYEECTKLLKENARAFPGTQNGPVQFNSVTDIIGGSAGIGFFLLYADQMMKDKEALPLAIRLADRLVALGESVAINGD